MHAKEAYNIAMQQDFVPIFERIGKKAREGQFALVTGPLSSEEESVLLANGYKVKTYSDCTEIFWNNPLPELPSNDGSQILYSAP